MRSRRMLEALIAGVVCLGVCSCRTIDWSIKIDINEMREDRDLHYRAPKKRYELHAGERYASLNWGLYDEVKDV